MTEETSNEGTIRIPKKTFYFVLGIVLIFAIGFAFGWLVKPTSTGMVVDNTQVQEEQAAEDWTVFENKIPSDIESKILAFDDEEPELIGERLLEFKNFESIPKTLIVFYHPGCGWCQRFHPVLLEAKEKYPEITIYTVLITDYAGIAGKYGIAGTPSNVINGKYAVYGYMTIEALTEILDEVN